MLLSPWMIFVFYIILHKVPADHQFLKNLNLLLDLVNENHFCCLQSNWLSVMVLSKHMRQEL